MVWLAVGADQDGAEAFARVQAVPVPNDQVAFEIDGAEVARYHYGGGASKPYVFPLIGPAGRRLTRLTHPHDPEGHGHHLSIWVGHRAVEGLNFWEESGCRIVHDRIEQYTDGAEAASVTARNTWRNPEGTAVLAEERTVTVWALPKDERYLDVVCRFTPVEGAVVLGKTPFGFFAMRVAKTMSVADGGGTIRNSEGAVDEEEVFWKRARWVDYAGPVTATETNGVALFDHPSNPRSPSHFHVRNDGWMGASFCLEEPFTIEAGQGLTLRYRLYAHRGGLAPEVIEKHWQGFAEAGRAPQDE